MSREPIRQGTPRSRTPLSLPTVSVSLVSASQCEDARWASFSVQTGPEISIVMEHFARLSRAAAAQRDKVFGPDDCRTEAALRGPNGTEVGRGFAGGQQPRGRISRRDFWFCAGSALRCRMGRSLPCWGPMEPARPPPCGRSAVFSTSHDGDITNGEITLDGESINRSTPSAIVRSGITRVMEGRRVLAEFTVDENLRIGAHTSRGALREKTSTGSTACSPCWPVGVNRLPGSYPAVSSRCCRWGER